MCKVRLIRKNNDAVNSDVVNCFDVSINPIDRPAYATYGKIAEKYVVNFIFINDKEQQIKLDLANVSIEYGVNSGRIYRAEVINKEINSTDSFNILKDSYSGTKAERFRDNVKAFISVINQIILYASRNPK